MLSKIFAPFIQDSPITVMAAAALGRLLSPARLDDLFDQARQGQYTHRLTFSTVFSLMAGVVVGTRKSIHHAYQSVTPEVVGASVVAVYDKLKGIETCTSQALVRDLAAEVVPLIDQMGGALPPLAPGYRVKILDGNCIAASEHRIKELRATSAGALPGKSLVVLDPQRRVILDVFPCEDGHAQERAILGQVLPTIAAGDLWIEDRNFCTFGFLLAIVERLAYFVTRQHGNMACQTLGPRKKLGAMEGGSHGVQKVEQEVSNYYIAAELETTSRGMMIAIPVHHWRGFAEMSAARFVAVMLSLAGKVNLRQFQKHPRGPKKPQPQRTYDPAHPHVSTAKLLQLRGPRKRRTSQP